MWIDRKIFAAEHDARIAAEAINASVVANNIAMKTTMDWMVMRMTQLEHERAQLISRYMGINVPVPSVEPDLPAISASDILNQTIDFNDMGDDAATRAGIGWNGNGELTYSKPK